MIAMVWRGDGSEELYEPFFGGSLYLSTTKVAQARPTASVTEEVPYVTHIKCLWMSSKHPVASLPVVER